MKSAVEYAKAYLSAERGKTFSSDANVLEFATRYFEQVQRDAVIECAKVAVAYADECAWSYSPEGVGAAIVAQRISALSHAERKERS